MSYKNMPMIGKVFLLLFVLGAVTLISTVWSAQNMAHIDEGYSSLLGGEAKAVRFAARANRHMTQLSRTIYLNIIADTEQDNVEAAKNIKSTLKSLQETLVSVKSLVPKAAADVDQIEKTVLAAMADSGVCGVIIKRANEIISAPEASVALSREMRGGCDAQLTAAGGMITQMNNRMSEYADKQSDDLTAITKNTIRNSYILGISGLVGALLLAAFATMKGIVAPIRSLSATMEDMKGGKLDVMVPGVERKDELGGMAKTVEVFRQGLLETEKMRAERVEDEKRAAIEKKRMMNELADQFQNAVGGIVGAVSSAATELEASANTLTSSAEETTAQSNAVAAASDETSRNVQTVASATEEMSASVREISAQVNRSNQIATMAVQEAADTSTKMAALTKATTAIGEIVNLINEIAGQTNLLALNATIEAARAGDAGKGFAVVASEVKQLAEQTSKATAQISGQIDEIQGASDVAVQAIAAIGDTITQMSEISTSIASAVEEQSSATGEISRNVQQAAIGTAQVSHNIQGVSQAASGTGQAAGEVQAAAGELARHSANLSLEVERFIATVRSA